MVDAMNSTCRTEGRGTGLRNTVRLKTCPYWKLAIRWRKGYLEAPTICTIKMWMAFG